MEGQWGCREDGAVPAWEERASARAESEGKTWNAAHVFQIVVLSRVFRITIVCVWWGVG
jgi:hypothetical protein